MSGAYIDSNGPRCRRCKLSEAKCAFEQGCCPACTHWPQEVVPVQRPAVEVVERRVERLRLVERDANEGLPPELIAEGLRLVGAVRSREAGRVRSLLAPVDRAGLYRLTVALAALVPTDKSAAELLDWCDLDIPAPVRPLRPCGTHAAYVRHRQVKREPACAECISAERRYQAARQQRRRSTASTKLSADSATVTAMTPLSVTSTEAS